MPAALPSERVQRVVASFGPPLPAGETFFEFTVPARVLYVDAEVTMPVAAALLQSVSIHDESGATVFLAGLQPLLLAASALPQTVLAIAGPEQGRVPFFVANVLVATIGRDVYGLPGYTLRFNNLGNVALTSAIVTVYLATDGS